MSQGIQYGGFVDRGPTEMSAMFGGHSTVALGNLVGPSGGIATAERASVNGIARGPSNGNDLSSMLTIPIALALGVLLWYALKTYD